MLKLSLSDCESSSPNGCLPPRDAMCASRIRAVILRSVSLVMLMCLGAVCSMAVFAMCAYVAVRVSCT